MVQSNLSKGKDNQSFIKLIIFHKPLIISSLTQNPLRGQGAYVQTRNENSTYY
jgi:hypothetical protein